MLLSFLRILEDCFFANSKHLHIASKERSAFQWSIFLSQSRISITFRDISLAAVGDDIGNGDMVGFFKSFDNIQYAVTDAGTQIENGGAFVFPLRIQWLSSGRQPNP